MDNMEDDWWELDPMREEVRSRVTAEVSELRGELWRVGLELAQLKADRVDGWVWCATCEAVHRDGERRNTRNPISAALHPPDPECAPHRWRALFAGGYLV